MNLSEAQAWNNIVASCDDSTFYHLHQWGTLLRQAHHHELIYLRENHGVFPLVCINSRVFGKRLISLPFADYGGPCARDESTAWKLILQCQERAQALGVDFIEIRSPASQYIDALEKQGFVRRDDYFTFVMRIDGRIEDIWQGMGDKTRNRVRKAEKSGVRVAAASDKSALGAFYLLYLKTMKRLGSPPQPYKFFEGIWDSFYPDHMMMPLAWHDGKCIAGGLSFLHGNVIHLAYSCSLSEHHDLAPNNLTWWYVIEWGNAHGCKYLNSGRTRQNEGTVLFKRRWGGDFAKMPYYYRFYKKTLKERQEIQYKWASRLWSRYVPQALADRLGPLIIRQIG